MAERPKVRGLSVLITRYVDAGQPRSIECEFADAAGRLWKIIEKVSVVTDQDISESIDLPSHGIVQCVESGRRMDEGGRELVAIDTELPFDIEATDGTHKFEVCAAQIQELSQLGQVRVASDRITMQDIEHDLASAAPRDAQFARSLDMLLAHLLSEIPDYVTDGVLLQHVETDERQIVVVGIAYLLERAVEPVRVELNLTVSGNALDSGALYFGDDSAPPTRDGFWTFDRLSRKILADPRRHFSWKYSWRRTHRGWSIEGKPGTS